MEVNLPVLCVERSRNDNVLLCITFVVYWFCNLLLTIICSRFNHILEGVKPSAQLVLSINTTCAKPPHHTC